MCFSALSTKLTRGSRNKNKKKRVPVGRAIGRSFGCLEQGSQHRTIGIYIYRFSKSSCERDAFANLTEYQLKLNSRCLAAFSWVAASAAVASTAPTAVAVAVDADAGVDADPVTQWEHCATSWPFWNESSMRVSIWFDWRGI